MNRIFALTAAAASTALLAACVPSTYGYGQQGYGTPYGSQYGSQYGAGSQFNCESDDHRVRRCRVDTRAGVRLVRQQSDAACIQGRTWGYDRTGVWVSHGCRARFELGGGYGNNTPGYGNDPYNQSQIVRCESQDERRQTCALPFRARSVTIRRQLSDTRCQFNYNWGWSADRVWVDRGCRAEFNAIY
jgi:hypothetical protein